jgi:hypothetical protein
VLTACGMLHTKQKSLHKWAEQHSKQWYRYSLRTKGSPLYYRVSLDPSKDRIHVHIEVVTKEVFKKASLPKASSDVIDSDALMNPFAGQEIEVNIGADMLVDPQRLPPIILMTNRMSATKDGVSMKMTGGHLSIEGAPISSIAWSIRKDERRSLIRMEGETKLTISENYLENCRQFVTTFANTFLEKEV